MSRQQALDDVENYYSQPALVSAGKDEPDLQSLTFSQTMMIDRPSYDQLPRKANPVQRFAKHILKNKINFRQFES